MILLSSATPELVEKKKKKKATPECKIWQQYTHLHVWPCQKCFRWTEPKNTFAETLTGTIIFSRHNVKQTKKGENRWDSRQKTIEIQSICKSFLAVIYKKQIACSVMHGDTKWNYISTTQRLNGSCHLPSRNGKNKIWWSRVWHWNKQWKKNAWHHFNLFTKEVAIHYLFALPYMIFNSAYNLRI